MNYNLYVLGRFCRNRFMNAVIIVPLLFAALFAYQAGNTFELTAGTSRISSASRAAYDKEDRHNANHAHLWPLKLKAIAVVQALVFVYSLPRALNHALRTAVPQLMRDLFMTPIKFTSQFVG